MRAGIEEGQEPDRGPDREGHRLQPGPCPSATEGAFGVAEGRAQTTMAANRPCDAPNLVNSPTTRRTRCGRCGPPGGICGEYLAASMSEWLDAMETEGLLVLGDGGYD